MSKENIPDLSSLARGLPLDPLPPPAGKLDESVPHAPARLVPLDAREFELAVANALRYFPEQLHDTLAPEFIDELRTDGHIYMRRFRPTQFKIKAYPIDAYPAKCQSAAAIMLMICNNLDDAVAQYPHELVTYGGNGSVLSNWAQFHILMNDDQTLAM
jgi:urocanate hydratase